MVGQVGEGGVDGTAGRRRGSSRRSAVGVGDLGRRAVVVERVPVRPPPPAAQLVEAGVGGDAVGPRAERGPAVEAAQAANHGDHRFLGGVGHVGIVAGDAPAHGMAAVVVTSKRLVEGSPIATLGCDHQFAVVEVGVHTILPVTDPPVTG